MKVFDFAIVGAGIAGASLAARLSGHGTVLLLEREPAPGYHATGRSAALFSALYGNAPVRALTRASRRFFDSPPHGFAEHPLLTPRGVLHSGTAADHEIVEALCASPLAKRISRAEALERVPILRAHAADCVASEPDASDIDVHSLHQGFLRMAKSGGATTVTRAEVLALKPGGAWQLHTTAGDFNARVLVNAAGAWADTLARTAGAAPLGLRPLRRTAVLIDPAPVLIGAHWPAVIAADESFYFKPDAGLLLATPADETPSDPCDAQPEALDVALCVERIETATTLSVKKLRRSWAGLRTFAPDRTPVVGYDNVIENFFWLAGQGGYGVQTSPALSDVAAALVLRKPLPAHVTDEDLDESVIAPGRWARLPQTLVA